jgi:hypothetical protein
MMILSFAAVRAAGRGFWVIQRMVIVAAVPGLTAMSQFFSSRIKNAVELRQRAARRWSDDVLELLRALCAHG